MIVNSIAQRKHNPKRRKMLQKVQSHRRLAVKSTAGEAAKAVRSGDSIVISGCGAAPIEFLAALSRRTELEGVILSHATAWGPLPHLAESCRPAHLGFRAYFLPAIARALHRRQEVDYVPLTFSRMDSMYSAGDLPADIVVVTCSTPDADGICSLGPFVSYLPAAIKKARFVIGECSHQWPRTRGAAEIHISTFDLLIDVARVPIPSTVIESDADALRIGGSVASLVPNGATIQIGRGAIPNAVAAALSNHRDLGVHSEMLSDWVVDLAQSGVITGAKKASYPGEIVTSFMDGTSRLYDFASSCETLRLEPIYEVNNPATISSEENFIAINSAVEMDLSGQINAETLNGQLISGSGGLLDFALGAAGSQGGKFIVAMPSTAKGGRVSRIVPRFSSGAAVTVPRALAHYVVTEQGIANLRGCSLAERAQRLIAISHPEFREGLCRASEWSIPKYAI
jgi:4-hydroxybutyrate CoA-transferase